MGLTAVPVCFFALASAMLFLLERSHAAFLDFLTPNDYVALIFIMVHRNRIGMGWARCSTSSGLYPKLARETIGKFAFGWCSGTDGSRGAVAGERASCPAQPSGTPAKDRATSIGSLGWRSAENHGGRIGSGHKAILMFHKRARCEQHQSGGHEYVSLHARSFLGRTSQELPENRAQRQA